MYRLQPTKTSTPTEKDGVQRPGSSEGNGSPDLVQPQKLNYNHEPPSQATDRNVERLSKNVDYKSDAVPTGGPDGKVEALLSKARALYCPSSSQPYATYVRPIKDRKTGAHLLELII